LGRHLAQAAGGGVRTPMDFVLERAALEAWPDPLHATAITVPSAGALGICWGDIIRLLSPSVMMISSYLLSLSLPRFLDLIPQQSSRSSKSRDRQRGAAGREVDPFRSPKSSSFLCLFVCCCSCVTLKII
jgi:hypothetical protein